MTPINELKHLVNKLFHQQYTCESTKISLSILQQVPKEHPVFNDRNPQVGSFYASTGVTRVERHENQQGILDMLYGVSRSSVGEEYHQFNGITPVERTYLTTAQLAELVYRKGSVTLMNPVNAVEIHADISRYIELSDYHALYSLHFKAPPQEDMAAFTLLAHVIAAMSDAQQAQNLGDTPFMRLSRKLLGATASSVTSADTDSVVTLNGQTQSAQWGPVHTDSPYRFK